MPAQRIDHPQAKNWTKAKIQNTRCIISRSQGGQSRHLLCIAGSTILPGETPWATPIFNTSNVSPLQIMSPFSHHLFPWDALGIADTPNGCRRHEVWEELRTFVESVRMILCMMFLPPRSLKKTNKKKPWLDKKY